AASIDPFLGALVPALVGIDAEVIFVDDSSDETPAVIERHAADSTLPVRLRHRALGERADGLGGAVKLGFEAAEASLIAVMDVGLQHTPALIQPMVATAMRDNADLVIGSRFTGAGRVGELGLARRAVSH